VGDRSREGVSFPVNNPQEVALEQREGKASEYDKEMYFLTNNRIMFLPKEAQVKLNYLNPAVGECLWITRRQEWVGNGKKRHSLITWDVSRERPTIHEPASNGQPGDPQAAAEATGIPETQLERQLRESKEVRKAAANRIRAKLNLEEKSSPVNGLENVAPELMPVPEEAACRQRAEPEAAGEPPRKPAAVETTPQPAPPRAAAPEPGKQPDHYIWFPNLVEVARSYTFKLNLGNYQTADFFCSQKAECRPEDADLVSDKLYEFCKRQVMKAVAAETGRRTA
jgi:hypothetical protein